MATIRTKGLIFPLELSNGKHVVREGEDLIKSSIKSILSWPIYNREYVDDFGSRISEAIEDQNDAVLSSLLKRFVIDPISKWEKRISLKSLEFDRPDYTKLVVNMTYIIRDINIEDSYTYTIYTT
jgi:phage baseplate assembly protein W